MSTPATPFIHCRGLVKIYQVEDLEVVALQGLDLDIEQGELIGVIGPSGSGKSTLLNVLGGLDAPTAGRARVAGIELNRMSPLERRNYRRITVGFVWQQATRNLVPYLTAVENVALPMVLGGRFDTREARRLLELVGLEARMRHRPRHMSGGEQQRVAIAIALANHPAVLLADEPTGSLDSDTAAMVLEVLDSVRKELGVTVVIVTHDESLARALDRYVGIRDGKTSTEVVRRTDEIHEAYTLLDSAGRLQLPPSMREAHHIKSRVKLVEADGRIFIVPADQAESGPQSS